MLLTEKDQQWSIKLSTGRLVLSSHFKSAVQYGEASEKRGRGVKWIKEEEGDIHLYSKYYRIKNTGVNHEWHLVILLS